jgi:hypothetical protein
MTICSLRGEIDEIHRRTALIAKEWTRIQVESTNPAKATASGYPVGNQAVVKQHDCGWAACDCTAHLDFERIWRAGFQQFLGADE